MSNPIFYQDSVFFKILRQTVFYVALFFVWKFLFNLKLWPSYLFPSPEQVGETLVVGFKDRSFPIAILITMKRLLIGYGLSIFFGVPIGLLIGKIKVLDETFGGFFVGIQTLPSICWLPLAILWFGLSESAILFVVVMGALMAISIGTHDAVKTMPPIYTRAAMTLGVRGLRLYREIILPAALPGIVTALKQGWTFAWRSLMSGELLFENPGLGHLLQKARGGNDMPLVVAVMIIIMTLGWSVDRFIFSALEQRLRRQRGMSL